ncbi:MAG: DegT/DnrJ/EryC1/StrS family aminotransferase [Treponema sp.]|jgi:dTDP-4-amino-4,6-dideoxygalactose transaminase|nr:DegT/DnrJ/EryC1/StrS family aminotransferase [Treponema sp.]
MTADAGSGPLIPFARPFVGTEEEEAVLRVLRSGWLTTGKEALAFEEEFSRFLAVPPADAAGETAGPGLPCLAVNSATSGLHLALEACGVKRGDLVLLPSYTFTSTAEVVRYLDAQPVFVDVVPGGFHIDPAALETVLKRLSQGLPPYPPRPGSRDEGFGPRGRPAAVIPVHYGGLPCDMAAVMDIAGRYGLKVIEDAAHSFPSYYRPKAPGGGLKPVSLTPKGAYAGTIGDLGVFSFYATKTISTGEGGMVACGNAELAGRVSLMRSHGIDRSIWNRYTDSKASWYYEVVEAGYKYNLPDLLAALGRVQLGRAWDLLRMRRELAGLYDSAFGADPHFTVPPRDPADARHLYPLRLNPETLRIGRDAFAAGLQEQGIGISVHFIPLHTMPYYRKAYDLQPEDFPHSLASFKREISLPLWPGMDRAMVHRVIDLVQSAAAYYTA